MARSPSKYARKAGVYRKIRVCGTRSCRARVPVPLCGMLDVNHDPLNSVVLSAVSTEGVVKAGVEAKCAAKIGEVTIEMPRPDAKVVLV